MSQTTALRVHPSGGYDGILTGQRILADIFQVLFEQSDICMASIDRNFRVNDANSAFSKQFKRRPEDIRGRDFQELLHPGIQSKVRRQFDGLTDGHHSRFVSHIVGLQPRDLAFPARLTVVAVHGADNRIDLAVAVVRPDGNEAESFMPSGQTRVLTALDARILEGLALGMSTADLAARLYLSRQGVEYHVTSLLRGFNAPNRPALVARAYSTGLLTVGVWPPKVLPDCVR